MKFFAFSTTPDSVYMKVISVATKLNFFGHKKELNALHKILLYSFITLFPDVHYDFLLSVALADKNT